MLDVLLIACSVLVALLVLGVLFAWRAVRRLRRSARIRLAAAGMRTVPRPVGWDCRRAAGRRRVAPAGVG